MTRYEATEAINQVINSGIIDLDLQETLIEVNNCICAENFEQCECNKRSDCCCCEYIDCAKK